MRAAYWTNGQAEVLLTGHEHKHLSDANLLLIAQHYAREIGIDVHGGRFEVGEWRENNDESV